MKVTIKSVVEQALKDNADLKDNDQWLVVYIWRQQLIAMGIDMNITAKISTVLYHVSSRNLYNHDSITRVRRELQEKQPELRGKRYKERHRRASEVAKDVGVVTEGKINLKQK